MKNRAAKAVSIFSIILVVIGCASNRAQTDPEDVAAQIEATKGAERTLITETVGDSDRASALLSLLSERDQLVDRQADLVSTYGKDLKALSARYDSTQAQFTALFAAYNAERTNYQSEFVNLVARMKAQTTDSEWKKIAKFQLGKMNPREAVYSQGGL